jgi:hypothetical protein
MKLTLDRHGPGLIPNHCHLPNPPYFELYSTIYRRYTVLSTGDIQYYLSYTVLSTGESRLKKKSEFTAAL